jgi:hypothetical protein
VDPTRIEIKSSWGGLGTPADETLVITGANGRYSAAGHKVDPSAVQTLLSAIKAPVIQEPTLAECGIDRNWLEASYKQALEDYTHEKLKDLSPKQVELFRTHFTDASYSQSRFAESFKGWHTDDYPKMTITVNANGQEFGVQSESQHLFMLPWVGLDAPRGGYSCQLSRAVAALLPKKFPNRERLTPGHSFVWELTSQVMRDIEHDWDLLETEYKVGPAVAPIFAKYSPLKSAISNLSSIDLDGRQAWNAELKSVDVPSNLILGVSLTYNNKVLFGTDEFLKKAPQYSKLVLSVPWLSKFLADHPDALAELRYVNGRSLSPKAQENLTKELQDHGKAELADRVSQTATESAFLEINSGPGCWTRAVVFPNKQVLVWQFDQRCESVLGNPPNSLHSWEHYNWRSTGTLLTHDGKPSDN